MGIDMARHQLNHAPEARFGFREISLRLAQQSQVPPRIGMYGFGFDDLSVQLLRARPIAGLMILARQCKGFRGRHCDRTFSAAASTLNGRGGSPEEWICHILRYAS